LTLRNGRLNRQFAEADKNQYGFDLVTGDDMNSFVAAAETCKNEKSTALLKKFIMKRKRG